MRVKSRCFLFIEFSIMTTHPRCQIRACNLIKSRKRLFALMPSVQKAPAVIVQQDRICLWFECAIGNREIQRRVSDKVIIPKPLYRQW